MLKLQVIFVTALPLSVAAQPTLTYTSDTVVISAERERQSLLEAPASISVADGKEIIDQGVDQIASAVKNEPGIRLQSDGTPGMNLISIRGEQPSRTAIMIDGQRLDDQKTKSGMPLLANPFFVKQIEIIRGASSVLYGSDAQAGIVNVITKDPSNRIAAFDCGVIYNGQGDGVSELFNVSGTIDKFSYALGAMHTDMGDRYLSGHNRLDNSSYYQNGLNALMAYKPLENLTVGFKADYFNLNAKTATTTSDPDYKDLKMHMPKWRRQKYSLFVNAEHPTEIVDSFKASVYIQNTDKVFSQQISPAEIDVDNSQQSFGGNLQSKFYLNDYFSLTAGYDVKSDQLDAFSGTTINTPKDSVKTSSNVEGARQTSHALYSLLNVYPTDNLTLNLGLRWNHILSKSGSQHKERNYQTQTDNPNYQDKTYSRYVSNLGAILMLNEESSLRAGISQGFKVPNLTQLFMTTESGGVSVSPNQNLKPERSLSYEIGYRLKKEMIDADATFFLSRTDDYIDKYQLPNAADYSWRNVAKVKSSGAEFAIRAKFSVAEPYLNLTVMNREFNYSGRKTRHTGTPKIFGVLGVRREMALTSGNWYFDLNLDFAGKAQDDDLGKSSYLQKDLNLAGYAVANVEIGTDLFFDKTKVRVFGKVNNMLDQSYRTSAYIHEPGRYFTLGVTTSF